MKVQTFLEEIAAANSARPGVHTLYEPAAPDLVAAWQSQWSVLLPIDLVELLLRSNGVSCHQQWVDGEPLFAGGAYRIFSIQEFVPAASAMYGEATVTPLTANWLAFGIGPDSALYFVFDVARRQYLAVPPIVPNEAAQLGPTIDSVLDIINPGALAWSLPF